MSDIDPFLRRAGWKPQGGGWSSQAGRRYWFRQETAPGSWDRSVSAYLAKAILHAQAAVEPGAESVAVLKVKRASALTDGRLARFVEDVAPRQSWILIDDAGQVFPHVASAPELARVAAEQARPAPAPAAGHKQRSLFTDLNQWMLKVLLAPQLPEHLLAAPRGPTPRNASTLAQVANVSLPAAARFLRGLEAEGQLDTRFGDVRVARPLDLLAQWRDRLGHTARREANAVSVRGPFNLEVMAALTSESARIEDKHPPLVLGVHAACAALGLGHVSGAVPVAWTPSLDAARLEPLELVLDTTGRQADVLLRVPRFPEALYRGAVQAKSAPATDVIQCWLDASHHRVRGEEQADFLWRTVLQPAFTP